MAKDQMKELERKAKKACRFKGNIWTEEEIRYGKAKAKVWAELFAKGRPEALIQLLKNYNSTRQAS